MKTYEELTNAIMNGTAADTVEEEAPAAAMLQSSAVIANANNAKQPFSTTAADTAPTTPTDDCNNHHHHLCRFFFQSMQCRFGSKCRFSHEVPQEGMTREEILQRIPCPHYERGHCFLGDACELLHRTRYSLENHDDDDDVHANNSGSQQKEEEEEIIIDTTCGICLENVDNTPKKLFGLLSCCNHIFCFSCLMEWRSSKSSAAASASYYVDVGISSSSRRVCPTCREPSNFVIPSNIFPKTSHQKINIIQNYKEKCSRKPCRKFVIGKLGSCPFGRDCFYAHTNEHGGDMKGDDKSMEELFEERERHRRRRRNNNSNGSDLDRIAEMLMMMALQRQLNGGRRTSGGGGEGQRRRRRGQQAVDSSFYDDDDDSDNNEEGFGINDMILQLLSMADNFDDESDLPLPMHQLFAAMGAFEAFNHDDDEEEDDDSSLDSMPPLDDLIG